MNSLSFVSAYRRDIAEPQWEHGVFDNLMKPARQWSHGFGQVLYDHLESPGTPIKDREVFLGEYLDWAETGLTKTKISIDQSEESEELKAEAWRELNFHTLNKPMGLMWGPIINAGWETKKSSMERAISISQDLLALAGLEFYILREKYAKANSKFTYFDEENLVNRATFEGMVQEFDTAVVLMEIAKQNPGLTVVPGPMQFEHDKKASINADFVVTHQEGEAIGVQVKSKVRNDDIRRYDDKRIVLVDGRIDLGNELYRRVSPKSSAAERVSWAGLICASQVDAIRLHGQQKTPLLGFFGDKYLAGKKMQARHLLGEIRPSMNDATRLIGERVLRHL